MDIEKLILDYLEGKLDENSKIELMNKINQEKEVKKLQEEDLIREYQGKTDPGSETDADIDAEEPWLPIETKMVIRSLIAGVVALIVLATLVHIFILGG